MDADRDRDGRGFIYPCVSVLLSVCIRVRRTIKMIYLVCLLIIWCVFLALGRRIDKKTKELLLKGAKKKEEINILNAEIGRSDRLLFVLRGKVSRYAALKEITEKLIRSLSLNNTRDILIESICSLLSQPRDKIKLYLWDRQARKLTLFNPRVGGCRAAGDISPGEGQGDMFDVWAVKHQMPLFVEDAAQDFRFDVAKSLPFGFPLGSLISAPLIVGKRIIGILRLEKEAVRGFSWDDLRFLSVFSDLAALSIDNSRLYEYTQRLAITDGLTGLYLRQYFMMRLNDALGKGKGPHNNEQVFSLLMVDIDYFKKYNDEFGHICGDIVLKRIALLLRNECRGLDVVISRYGEEEFAILLAHS